MKKIKNHLDLVVLSIVIVVFACLCQSASAQDVTKASQAGMKTYVIERNIPGAGEFSAEKLKTISKTSCTVLKEMGPGIQWIQSYVTGDKIFCIYKAENMEMLREHAQKGGFPINNIYEVANVISPATAN